MASLYIPPDVLYNHWTEMSTGLYHVRNDDYRALIYKLTTLRNVTINYNVQGMKSSRKLVGNGSCNWKKLKNYITFKSSQI